MNKEEMLEKCCSYYNDLNEDNNINLKDEQLIFPNEINKLLMDWSSKTNPYQETFGTDNNNGYNDCSKTNHYLCKYYIDKIKPDEKYDYLDIVAKFLTVGDVVYAITILDIVLLLAEKAKSRLGQDNGERSINAFISSAGLLRYWIENDNNLIQNVKHKPNITEILDDELSEKRGSLNKELIYKIDGAIALAKEIGTEKFIQYAIDQCYFFEPKIVEDRMKEIVKDYYPTPHNDLYARHSEKGLTDYEISGLENSNDQGNKTGKGYYNQRIDYLRTAIAAKNAAVDAKERVNHKKKSREIESALKAAANAVELANWAAKMENESDERIAAAKNAATIAKKAAEDAKNTAKTKMKDNGNQGKKSKNNAKESKKQLESKYYLFCSTETGLVVNDYPIIIDTDGNQKLRSVINKKTGYTVGAGKENIFQNYRISHVWGRAYDPRFFTNLWNVVLVPAWANDLLDKPNAIKGSLESRLQSTIMRICELLYFEKLSEIKYKGESLWKILKMTGHPKVTNDKDIVPSSKGMIGNQAIPKERTINNTPDKKPYIINVILDKKDKMLGDIVKYAVYV